MKRAISWLNSHLLELKDLLDDFFRLNIVSKKPIETSWIKTLKEISVSIRSRYNDYNVK